MVSNIPSKIAFGITHLETNTKFKQTEVDKIPQEWKVVKTGDVCTSIVPGRNKPKVFDGDIPWITIPDLDGLMLSVSKTGFAVSREELKRAKGKTIPSDTVVMTCVGTFGIAAVTTREIVINQQLHGFVCKEDILPLYLCWVLRSKEAEMIGLAGKTTIPYLNREKCESICFALPSLPEQKKIVAILSSVDEAIAKTQAVIDQTRKVKQGLLQQLLTRGIGHTKFKPLPDWIVGRISGISKIPQEWNLVCILDVARLESGHTPSRDKDEYWNGTIPWISLHDSKFLDKRVITETAMYVTELGIKNSSARILPAGTVVFSRTASVGHCVIMGREMATSQDFANYICGENLHNRYLMHLFRWIQPVWNGLASGSVHSTIYMPAFKQLKILLPPLFEQIQIAEIVDCFDNVIEDNNNKLEQLSILKRGLMQDLLTGRVRVKGA